MECFFHTNNILYKKRMILAYNFHNNNNSGETLGILYQMYYFQVG